MAPFVLATLPACTSSPRSWGASWVPGRIGEDHEVVFVVAEDELTARRAAKAKWGGGGRPHVDALTRLDMIDGYGIGLTRRGEGDATETVGYNE